MSNQNAHIEDPDELNILRAINRGETRLETVDWKPYLSDIVKMIGLMNPPISYIGCAWALLQEIDDSIPVLKKQIVETFNEPRK